PPPQEFSPISLQDDHGHDDVPMADPNGDIDALEQPLVAPQWSQRVASRLAAIIGSRYNLPQNMEQEDVEEDSSDSQSDYSSNSSDSDEDEGEQVVQEALEVPTAQPGQEGLSVWDLECEGFLREAMELGKAVFLCSLYDYSSQFFRRQNS